MYIITVKKTNKQVFVSCEGLSLDANKELILNIEIRLFAEIKKCPQYF